MSDSDETGGPSFFGAFMGAMLERSLPAIREWLRARLGPRATLGEVSVEAPRITVRGAQIPIGASVVLSVEEATLLARPEGFVAGQAPARLEQLRGTLRFERGALTTLEAPVEIEGRAGDPAAWVDGELRLAGATWRATRGVGAAMPLEGTAQLRIAAEAWSVRDAKLTSGGSKMRGWASGALGGGMLRSGELEVDRARLGHTLDVLEAFRGRALDLPVPLSLDALLDVKLALGDGRWRGDATVTTDRSELRLRFTTHDGALDEGTVQGRAHPRELFPESWRGRLAMDDCGVIEVDANAKGPFAALEGIVDLKAERFALREMVAPNEARALFALRGADGFDFDLKLGGAGRAHGQARLGPQDLAGTATVTLEPGAFRLGEARLDGDPLTLALTLGGTRAAPSIDAGLSGARLELVRGDRTPLSLRRLGGRGRIEGGAIVDARLDARLGPGRLRVTHDEQTRLQIDRADRGDLLALHDLIFRRPWLGGERGEARFVVPEGAQGWADVSLSPERLLEGTLHLEAPRSRLSFAPLRVDLTTGATAGSTARAILSWEDARSIGLFDGSPLVPLGPGAAELGATLTGAGREMRLFVSARARELSVGRDPEAAPIATLERVAARMVIDASGLDVQELSGELYGGRFEVVGAIADRRPRLERLTWSAGGEALRARLLGDDPGDALRGLSVRLAMKGKDDWLEGEAEARTDRSALHLRMASQGRVFLAHATELEGRLDPSDLDGLIGSLRARTDAPLTVEGALRGAWSTPVATLALRGGAGRISTSPTDEARALPFEELAADLTLTRARSELSARVEGLSGGRAKVDAALATERPLLGWLASVELEDVELGPANDEVEGRLSSRAVLWQLAGTPMGIRASATLSDPRYRALKRLEPAFERYGLRAPPPMGTAPATLRLELDRGWLRISELEAAIEGLAISGAGLRSPEGGWEGEVLIEAAESWLRTSRLLRTPAEWLGDLVVPIRISGPDGALRLRADVLAALDRAIAQTKLGQGVQRAMDRVLEELFSRPRPPERAADHHAASEVTGSDALIDRVARGDRDADRALGALLERGYLPAELVERITRRRARDP